MSMIENTDEEEIVRLGARIEELLRDREALKNAMEAIIKRVTGPYNSQLWDIRQIAETAISLSGEEGK